MSELVVENLIKDFGAVRAVNDVSFTVKDGEFLTLLGPSGCGKSTILAAIAGLDRPDGGSIRLGDHVFFDGRRGFFVPPEKRNIGLVFQSYALWPHMTVRQNLDFPLSLRSIPSAERSQRIEEVLALVEMTAYADRYPYALSGGQQQRVALARTLVYRPPVLLLDEPLSNLDAKLRERARVWLRELQNRIGVTTVYVTHDQTEALDLSDRIAVINEGKIVQLADPGTIYDAPRDPFVADFIGSANIFSGRVLEQDGGPTRIGIGNDRILLIDAPLPAEHNQDVRIALRPERIVLFDGSAGIDGNATNVFEVAIVQHSFLGARHMVTVNLDGLPLRIECDASPKNAQTFIRIPNDACSIFAMQ